jgi:hypothetical protein
LTARKKLNECVEIRYFNGWLNSVHNVIMFSTLSHLLH